MAAMNYLEGKRNAQSYWLGITVAGASQPNRICKFMLKINMVRVKMMGRSDGSFRGRGWKNKPSLAEKAVLGQVGHKKQRQND